MQYLFSAANQALLAQGQLIQLTTTDGKLLPILVDSVKRSFVEIAKGTAKNAPLLAINPPLGAAVIGTQILGQAASMYQNHQGFQAVLQELTQIQASLGVLQTTTSIIGVGVAAGVVLSGINLWQTLKLRDDIKQLKLEVKDGFIDLKKVILAQNQEIIEHINRVADDLEFRQHRLILIQAYQKFLEAIRLIKTALSCNDPNTRNSELVHSRQILVEASSEYNNPRLFEQTSAAGRMRRYECAWILEQAIAITYQLQNELNATSDRLLQLQERIRQDCYNVVRESNLEAELDFIFPEVLRIYNHDLSALGAWQNNIHWLTKISHSEREQLVSLETVNNKIIDDTNQRFVLTKPPELSLYEDLQKKTHASALRDYLALILSSSLRQDYEEYVNDTAPKLGLKSLISEHLKQASELTLANLYWYCKAEEEREV